MDRHGVHKLLLLTFYCRRIWMTNERKVSLNTRYQDMNTFRAHFNPHSIEVICSHVPFTPRTFKVTEKQLLLYSLLTQILLPMENSYFYYLWVAAKPQVTEVQCLAWKLTFHKELYYETLTDKQFAGECRSICINTVVGCWAHTFSETAVKIMAWVISDSPKVNLSALFMFFRETPNTNS